MVQHSQTIINPKQLTVSAAGILFHLGKSYTAYTASTQQPDDSITDQTSPPRLLLIQSDSGTDSKLHSNLNIIKLFIHYQL